MACDGITMNHCVRDLANGQYTTMESIYTWTGTYENLIMHMDYAESFTKSVCYTWGSMERQVEHISETYVQPSLLGLGILTNLVTFLILYTDHKTDSTANKCLVWLALSDLCVAICGFTHILLESQLLGGDVMFGLWSTAGLVNYIFYFLYLMFLGNSALVVVQTAILRSLCIAKPIKYRIWVSDEKIRWMFIISFIITVAAFLPTGFTVLWQMCFNETEVQGCVNALEQMPGLELGSRAYLHMLGVVYIVIPVVINIICFVIIKISLHRSADTLSRMSVSSLGDDKPKSEVAARQKVSLRITCLFLCILIIDSICTIPTIISCMVLLISDTLVYNKNMYPAFLIFDELGEILLLIRPTYNFWLYIIIHRDFRKRLLHYVNVVCSVVRGGVDELLHQERSEMRTKSHGSDLSSEMVNSAFEADPKQTETGINSNLDDEIHSYSPQDYRNCCNSSNKIWSKSNWLFKNVPCLPHLPVTNACNTQMLQC